MVRYTLYINFKDKIVERPLPAENDRHIELDLSDIVNNCKITFEVFDNVWCVLANSLCTMTFEGQPFVSHVLKDGDVIKAQMTNNCKFVIMVYEITNVITEFTKYNIKGKSNIKIGKNNNCDISINSVYISGEHAALNNDNGRWIYKDNSLNGSYINGTRINGQLELEMFDTIYTVGFKMVFLGDSIAINRKDIVACRLDEDVIVPEIECKESEDTIFWRSPRTVEPLFDDVIEIGGPPMLQKQRNQPLLFVIGPSVTMPLPILMSTFINSQFNNSSRSYLGIIASVGMSAVIGAGWAIAHYMYNKKIMCEDEAFRVSAYRDYICKNEQLIIEKQDYDNSVLSNQYLSSEDIVLKLSKENSFIWNRNINQEDFLTVRIGTGNVDFSSHINVPKQRFSLCRDEMAELPHRLLDKYKYISDAVVTVNLKKTFILGILGERVLVNKMTSNVILQIAALHCYTDVKIAAFITDNEYNDFSWVRWLPHTNSEDLKIRMVACDKMSYQNVLYHIDEVLRRRAENLKEENKDGNFIPHYVVICTDRSIFDGDGIEKYIPMAEALGFTFILAYKRLDCLPNECCNVIQCDDDFIGSYSLRSRRSESDRIKVDAFSIISAESFAKKISRLKVREYATGGIPSSIEYFDMLGIGKLEQWDLIKKYKENRVYEGISSFIGIGVGGKPMYIDIHEKKHGPHGLVAGTTGSGKSETLQTFIISLALNYRPDEVSFILIDYKGGGMALAFEGMPHIAGMITNLGGENSDTGELDSNITRRALVSIRSEIKYRQAIFNKYKVNHIDSYIRLYRDGTANEPLPHLVIISDEFAELKKEQPEFIKELVSIARVGRSLGVHLILATQKPGGVVDDEIRSNARFKLCLRVQDKQDSNEMLRRPEAAYLTQSGQAYFQLGNDEVFEQFQTGYSGADYIPREDVGTASDSELYMMNIDGTAAVARERRDKKEKSGVKQLKAAVDYINKICAENSIKTTRALWLDELPKRVILDDIIKSNNISFNGITAVFGLIDDPEHQRQYPAIIDLSVCSNLLICGISGIGKTTMLQTMLVSLINNYTCEQLSFYILDFSSRTLKMFSDSKHCGLAAFSDDREAVTRLFQYVNSEMNRRKDLFNSFNVGSFSEYIKKHRLPLVLVIVDNFYSFNELYPELADDFSRITRDCAKYGIQVVITCNNLGDIRYKLRQNFGNTLTLCVAEKSDYREAWGISAEFIPKNTQGRGLILSDGHLLEYQTALPCLGESESERYDVITNLISIINDRDKELKTADTIRTIPLSQSYEEFLSEYSNDEMIPVGYNTDDISIYGISFTNTFCYAVSEIGTKGISLTLGNILIGAKNAGLRVDVIKLKNDIKINTEMADKVCRDKESVSELILSFRETFNKRAIDKKQFLLDNPDSDFAEFLCKKYEKHIIIIDSMNEFLNMIYDTSNEKQVYPFVEAYFKNGLGMGIYFVAGFDASVYGTNFYQPACKCFVDYKQGIHLGGRYDKQKIVDVNMTMSQMSKSADYFTGISNDNGGEIKVIIPGGKNED